MKDNPRFKILIVDDVTRNIQLVASILKEVGYEIYYALDGPMALEQLKRETFDLILLDIMMPGMDGFEVCKKIKENPEYRDIPIIFLTAKADIESIKHGFKIGGVDYITKPFNREELLARVKTHLNIQQSRKELQSLNATRDRFFSIIAHDLKSPFNQLLGLSELIESLAAKSDDEEIRKMALLINESAKRGKDLLENLLDWSRNQTGSIGFNPTEIPLASLIGDMVEMTHYYAKQKSIEIKMDIPPDLVVTADENMLKTVIRNLLTNAIKFTGSKGTIQIGAAQEQDQVHIAVQDNGVGIKQEILPKLFRVDQNPTTKGTSEEKGTGLGLILCKEFVDIHGGKIWAESSPGEGSVFHVVLPFPPGAESNYKSEGA
jgi:signal transduction histidine kinase